MQKRKKAKPTQIQRAERLTIVPTVPVEASLHRVITAPNGQAAPITTPSELTLRECLIQASNNARTYMDLRFKHFGTFVVLTGLLGGAAFRLEALTDIRTQLAGIAWVLSILFWFLDFRTSQYLADELHRVHFFKELLYVPSSNVPKRRVLLRASHATNLIFCSTLVMWGIIFWHNVFT